MGTKANIWWNALKNCIFCQLENSTINIENNLALCFNDQYPVTSGHSLIIPKRHVQSFFELTIEERIAMFELLDAQKIKLQEKDNSITSFNLGVNDGSDAGQTIMHCHIHLIPRRSGDMKNPRGGVRGVIPEKQSY